MLCDEMKRGMPELVWDAFDSRRRHTRAVKASMLDFAPPTTWTAQCDTGLFAERWDAVQQRGSALLSYGSFHPHRLVFMLFASVLQ